MIPTNIFYRVVHLGHGDHSATGTVLHVDGREYIATAKHFAELLVNEVELYHEGGWVRTSVTLVGHSSLADVSVLALPESFVDTEMVVEMTQAGMIYGGEVFFL